LEEGEHGAGWDEADFAAEFFAFGGKDENGGDALDGVVLGERLFLVDVDSDHEPVGGGGGDARVTVGFCIEHFAWAAPGGEEIDHDGLTGFFGLSEGGRKISEPIDSGGACARTGGRIVRRRGVRAKLFLESERQHHDGEGDGGENDVFARKFHGRNVLSDGGCGKENGFKRRAISKG
jgi:hypothetical protein